MADKAAGAAATSTGAEGTTGTAGTGAAAAATTGAETKPGAGEGGKTADDGAAAGAAAAAGKTGEKADTTGKGGDEPQPKAPAKYDLKVPDGGDVYIAADDLADVEAIARANDWSNEEAQAEIAAAVERGKARDARRSAAHLETLKADPDYGGDKLPETQRLAKRAIDAIAPVGHKHRDAFLALVNSPGVVNNPAVVAILADLGKRLGEDSPQSGRAGGSTQSAADKLYDHPTSKKLEGRE